MNLRLWFNETERTTKVSKSTIGGRNTSQDVSFEECISIPERELRCPYCTHYIEGVFADTAGHVRVKCNKCKAEMVLNVAYFHRMRRYRQESRYRYAESYYLHKKK